MAKTKTNSPLVMSKYWTVVTYSEWCDNRLMAQRLDYGRVLYAYILHDKDVWTSEDEEENPEHKAGTFKKEHTHWCLEFTTPHTEEYVCRIFGANMAIPMKRDKKLSYRYLLHLDHPQRYRYCLDDVQSNNACIDQMMVLECEFIEHRNIEMMCALQAVADYQMSWWDFYQAFPEMIYKACVAQTLVKQLSARERHAVVSDVRPDVDTRSEGIDMLSNARRAYPELFQ